eukprot:1993930-Amphidinium_carterae.1
MSMQHACACSPRKSHRLQKQKRCLDIGAVQLSPTPGLMRYAAISTTCTKQSLVDALVGRAGIQAKLASIEQRYVVRASGVFGL